MPDISKKTVRYSKSQSVQQLRYADSHFQKVNSAGGLFLKALNKKRLLYPVLILACSVSGYNHSTKVYM